MLLLIYRIFCPINMKTVPRTRAPQQRSPKSAPSMLDSPGRMIRSVLKIEKWRFSHTGVYVYGPLWPLFMHLFAHLWAWHPRFTILSFKGEESPMDGLIGQHEEGAIECSIDVFLSCQLIFMSSIFCTTDIDFSINVWTTYFVFQSVAFDVGRKKRKYYVEHQGLLILRKTNQNLQIYRCTSLV